MNKCIVCKKQHNRRSEYCSKKCYWTHYYLKNKDRINDRTNRNNKEKYVPHPKIFLTDEERKAKRKKYYEEHKEYYRQKNKEHYLKNKNDPKYRQRHNEATKKYQAKIKLKLGVIENAK